MSVFLALAGLTGIATGLGLGLTNGKDSQACLGSLGQYCESDSDESRHHQCVKPINPAWNEPQYPRPTDMPILCDPNATVGSKLACTGKNLPANTFCSPATLRCTVPVGVNPVATQGLPCKNRCVNPNAFCDSFAKKCAVVVDGKTTCAGFGNRGTCADGQTCSAILGTCVTLGLPCLNKNHLYFSFINESEKRCGDVDGASRVPDVVFEPGVLARPYTTLKNYIQDTNEFYVPIQNQYLSQSKCEERGYSTPAGSTVAPWAPAAMMAYLCEANACGCQFPDCPDSSPSPCGGPFQPGCFCSLCGPKYNAPIKINFWTK